MPDFYDFFRMFLKNLIEPKLQPIEAPPGEFFLKVRNGQNSSNFVDFFSKNCQNLADLYEIFRMLLKYLIEPKLQPIEAAPGDVF